MSYRADKLVIDARTNGHTHRQTQATTIPEGQYWPRVKTHPNNPNISLDQMKGIAHWCNGTAASAWSVPSTSFKAPVTHALQRVCHQFATKNWCNDCNHCVIKTAKFVRNLSCRSMADQCWATTTHKHWWLVGHRLATGRQSIGDPSRTGCDCSVISKIRLGSGCQLVGHHLKDLYLTITK